MNAYINLHNDFFFLLYICNRMSLIFNKMDERKLPYRYAIDSESKDCQTFVMSKYVIYMIQELSLGLLQGGRVRAPAHFIYYLCFFVV